jgi:hypothetical protein
MIFLHIFTILQGAQDKEHLSLLFGGPNVILAAARRDEACVTLCDSKGVVVGKIVGCMAHRTEDDEGETKEDREHIKAIIVDDNGRELLHEKERTGWLGGFSIVWSDAASGQEVAVAKRRIRKPSDPALNVRLEWDFAIYHEIVHPCFFLFSAAYRSLHSGTEMPQHKSAFVWERLRRLSHF